MAKRKEVLGHIKDVVAVDAEVFELFGFLFRLHIHHLTRLNCMKRLHLSLDMATHLASEDQFLAKESIEDGSALNIDSERSIFSFLPIIQLELLHSGPRAAYF